jgi:cysteine desulfurase
MSAERTYLDWNATAPLRPEARAAMLVALECVGNPSSVHAEGRAARHLVEQAREQVAALVNAEPREIVFISGGTEANALALTPALEAGAERAPRDWLLASTIEHPSVRAGGQFPPERVSDIPVSKGGMVDLSALQEAFEALRRRGVARPLVSIMAANNETGALQPVAEAAAIVHAAGGLLHVDAVQAAGKIPCDFRALGADLMTLSAHKLGGPKGVGALAKRPDLHLPDPLIKGGGQERGARAGTENVAGIAGFGAAAAAARRDLEREAARLAGLRERLEAALSAISADTVIFAGAADRLPNTTLFAVPGMKAETALIALDLAGVAVSSGSACSSGKVAASHVLAAMGIEDALARGAIRVSTGFLTTQKEVDRFLDAWKSLVHTLPRRAHGIAA